jgi:hypothetical protein
MRTLGVAIALMLTATTPAAGMALDDLAAALDLVPIHGVAPSLSLERLVDGKTVALRSLRGRPVLVYFWATW